MSNLHDLILRDEQKGLRKRSESSAYDCMFSGDQVFRSHLPAAYRAVERHPLSTQIATGRGVLCQRLRRIIREWSKE